MAINQNINPYQVGAVVADNRPFLQFYQQQLAQRQAKESALDNYFRDLGKNVTPTGMRAQDVEGLTNKTNEWRQFYAQNKDAISNPRADGGKAYTEYMARYQDQLGHIEQSKRALKTTDELNKTRLNPNASYILDDPSIVDKIHAHDLPLGDPRRQDLDIATLAVPPKPWGIKDKEAYNKYLTSGLQYNEVPGQTEYLPGFKTKTPVIKQFSEDNMRVIGQRAMGAYETDRALQTQGNHLMKNLMNDQASYDQLNNIYKKLYNKDIEQPQEALAAQAILDHSTKATEYKLGDDTFGKEKALMAMRQMNAKELIDYKKKVDPNDTEMNNVWYQTYLDDVINTAKQSGEKHHVYTNKGRTVAYYNMIKPDPFLMKSFQRGKSEPDRLGVTESGEIIPIFFKYKSEKEGGGIEELNGKPVIDTDYSQPLSYNQALVNLGYRGSTKKQLKEDQGKIQAKQKTSTGKPKRVIQDGHEYILNEATNQYE